MKKIIFVMLYFIALPLLGYEVTEKFIGALAFMAIVAFPIYLCSQNKNMNNFLLKIAQ